MAEVGLVVMAYGTPATPDDIEAYYSHIRRGHAPSAEQLADLTARYQAIGGTSPLAERTEAQRVALATALDAVEPGRWAVALGQKHAAPFIEDAVAQLAAGGVGRIVGLVLAPHFAAASVGQYQERLHAAAAEHGVPSAAVDSWHLEPAYVALLADAVRDGRAELPERTTVLFTAHSLPERALVGDPYPDQLQESAAAVAAAVGLADGTGWSLAYQSAGRTADPWRGPDVLEVIDELAASGGADAVLVCPQGFVSDHLEVVYDLDLEARRRAEGLGLAFARTRVCNDDPTVMAALAARVRALAPS
jgi:ferrochelatase